MYRKIIYLYVTKMFYISNIALFYTDLNHIHFLILIFKYFS